MKMFRFIAGVFLVPFAAALFYGFYNVIVEIGRTSSTETVPFWAGLIGYFIFQAVLSKPLRTYVFGHELTHAVAGLLSGAILKSFRVSEKGGSVVLDKTNIWICLAPYFLPIYTVILISAYWIAGLFYPVDAFYPYFLFLAGFSLSFHFSLTHFALMQGQSDLKVFGSFFSSVFIVIITSILMVLLLKALFNRQVNLTDYFSSSLNYAVLFYSKIYHWSTGLWQFFTKKS